MTSGAFTPQASAATELDEELEEELDSLLELSLLDDSLEELSLEELTLEELGLGLEEPPPPPPHALSPTTTARAHNTGIERMKPPTVNLLLSVQKTI
ncbi:hypothetical protein QWI17_11905 [Gilvimarinus sp. SDUM040013]|uniref:Uncharacterized protein n=1 Tax=Gilvimarinus gilvus TaxID=3058038 RepID=A0ABU4RY77_9GAMM|nr:hypothetical protein [Gilvimarinus sp. SDUM040013]MDO3386540.1 hypothetical protein [Gilvimarinus sp. SDUM040013]MDX6849116.1 hypothetical protein [Gilvimarinus sp. SDUM040013]